VIRRANSWTPNKDWPDAYWETLVDRLLGPGKILDLGTASFQRRSRIEPNYRDLIGRTMLPQLVAAIAGADLLITPAGPAAVPLERVSRATEPKLIDHKYNHEQSTSVTGLLHHRGRQVRHQRSGILAATSPRLIYVKSQGAELLLPE
jgi:hypothetical protein